MRINEILTESQQLDEGPIGTVVNKVGRGIGKAIGGVAKAAGAVSGAVQGAKTAYQKGKQAAADVVGGTEPTSTNTTPPTIQQINTQGPAGTAPVKQQSGLAQQALQKITQATQGVSSNQAGETLYSQIKSQINQLDKKGKQRILQLLQKSLTQPVPKAAKAGAAPAAQPAVAPAATPAQQPAAKSTTGPGSTTVPAEPGAAPRIEPDLNAPAGEKPATAAGKKKPIPKKKVSPSQAQIDADRERLIGPTSDSIIRRQSSLVENKFQFFKPR